MRTVTIRVQLLPNPFGGVNTHLWSKEAYIVGIVPLICLAYSTKKRNGKGTEGKGLACWGHGLETEEGVLPTTENSEPS